MAYCGKCGYHVDTGLSYCPKCGAPLDQNTNDTQNTSTNSNTTNQFVNLNKTNDYTQDFTQEDIQKNKTAAILAYIGILVLVPLLSAKDSKFAKFHANQGLVLLITAVAYGIVLNILSSIFVSTFIFSGSFNPFYWITGILRIGYVGITVLAIIGIVNAASGKAAELPIIGSIKILK